MLSCKRVAMSNMAQYDLFEQQLPDQSPSEVVPCRADMAWKFIAAESFDTITVTPSLDASASGHWHGCITAGRVVGDVQC